MRIAGAAALISACVAAAGAFARLAHGLVSRRATLRSCVLVRDLGAFLRVNRGALAPFAPSWQPLLLGVDLGGLGDPAAPLASPISLNLLRRCAAKGQTVRFTKTFPLANMGFLAALCALYVGFAILAA